MCQFLGYPVYIADQDVLLDRPTADKADVSMTYTRVILLTVKS